MRENALRLRWADQKPALGGWLQMPGSFSAEIMASTGFDWVCVDLQHGIIDYTTMVPMLQAISTTPTVPLVRVPWNETGIIGKVLDAGARGVIVPMVNSGADAKAAVAACRYAPRGHRSYGPTRAAFYAGFDYYQHANDDVICIVMVETSQALAHLDDIVSVDGVDAVFVGPADLSITLGLQPRADNLDEVFVAALDRILDGCKRHGVVPGIAGNAKTAPRRIEQGFLLVEIASDAALLGIGATRALRSVAPSSGAEERTSHL
jgi:4-hydroxy-2-oxoheptanedioate aldolase